MLRAKVPHIEPNEADIAYYARLEKISGEKITSTAYVTIMES